MSAPEQRNAPASSRWLKRRGRRGIAILLTLGILSLLLIMAMGFLFNSSTGRTVSIVNADAVRAKMLADSALQRFAAMIERDFSSVSDMNPGVGFYAPTTGDWYGRRYVATVATGGAVVEGTDSPLYASLAGYDFTPPSLSTDASLAANVQWVDVVSYKDTSATGTAGTDSVARTIGRFCLLGIDETGKIDPGAAVPTATEVAGGDTGADFGEIFINNAFATALASPGQFYSNLGPAPKWDSWYHLLKGGITGLTVANGGPAIFPHSREIEAFADFTDTSIAKHRFDLKNWDATPYTDLTAAPTNFSGANTGGIQWLNGGSNTALHVAMNLKDYCDTDYLLTTDGATPPNVTGNEKVPAINEIKLQVDMPAAVGTGATVRATVELVNLYDEAGPPSNGELYITATYAATAGLVGGTLNFTIPVGAGAVAAKSYALSGTNAQTTAAVSDAAGVSDFQLTDIRVEFRPSAGSLWDYAYISTVSAQQNLDFTLNNSKWIFVGVNDPRINHFNGQWGWTAWDDVGSAPVGQTFSGERNSQVTVGTSSDDNESTTAMGPLVNNAAVDTTSLSTAYIRNGPPESLWELGAIHRGAAWQTLNLDAYNAASATIGTYAAGDANILDHVKLTADTVVDGKFNANSRYEMGWRAMIGHLELGDDYDDATAGSRAVVVSPSWTTTDGYRLAQAAMMANGSFVNRGQIASIAAMSDTTYNTTYSGDFFDKDREELIGKIAHHLTTRSNWYSVVVCAQAIQPELYAARNEIKVLAESKMLAVVYRDAFTGEVRIEHIQPLDD